jgi:hypothetical protein
MQSKPAIRRAKRSLFLNAAASAIKALEATWPIASPRS